MSLLQAIIKPRNAEAIRKALEGSSESNPVEHEEALKRAGMARGLFGFTMRNLVYRSQVYKKTVYWLPPK